MGLLPLLDACHPPRWTLAWGGSEGSKNLCLRCCILRLCRLQGRGGFSDASLSRCPQDCLQHQNSVVALGSWSLLSPPRSPRKFIIGMDYFRSFKQLTGTLCSFGMCCFQTHFHSWVCFEEATAGNSITGTCSPTPGNLANPGQSAQPLLAQEPVDKACHNHLMTKPWVTWSNAGSRASPETKGLLRHMGEAGSLEDTSR